MYMLRRLTLSMYFEEFNNPEWRLLSQVSRPYTKTSWDNTQLKICLAFLSSAFIALGLVASVYIEEANSKHVF